MQTRKTVHVVVGIIQNPDKNILLAQRQHGQHLAGLWEFPGGKVDEGESAEQALIRELHEELGIYVTQHQFLFDIPYNYPEKTVCLHCFLVTGFDNIPEGKEGQPLQWYPLQALKALSLPPANTPIIEYLLNDQ